VNIFGKGEFEAGRNKQKEDKKDAK
jgi:hypothetical protein